MSQPTRSAFGDVAPNRRHAWYAALLVACVMVITLLLACYYASVQLGTIISPMTLVIALPVIGWAVGLTLMARGRFEHGIHIALIMMACAAPLTSLYVQGRGLILGIGIGVAILFVATLALPPSRAQWFIVLGVFVGLLTVALDVFGAPTRLNLQFSSAPGIFLVGVIILFFLVFVALNFNAYPLRVKLLLTFVAIALISVGGVTFIATRSLQTTLRENAARDLQTRAQAAALSVGITMDRNVDRLQTMTLDNSMQSGVTLLSDSYPAQEQASAELIASNEKRWASADPQDPLIRNALNGDLANSLRQFGNVYRGNTELFVTDARGSVVAATDWQPQYNFSQEPWWRIAYGNGVGGMYVGQPEFHPMANANGVRIAVPIFSPGSQRAVGVLHAVFTLTAMHRALLYNNFGATGKIDVLFPMGEILTADGEFRALSADEFTQIKDAIGETLPALDYNGASRLSSQGVVGVSDEQPEPYLRASAWRTIATIQADELLALVEAGTRGALLAGMLAIAAAILVALVLAQILTRPIQRLTLTANQVQAGDLGARAPVESRDEIGALASSFNNMTARLQDTLTGLEQRVTERTQELSDANLSLQSNSAYLSALSDTSTGLFERQGLNDLLQATVERAGALMGTQNGFVFFQQAADQDIVMRVGTGLYDDLIGTQAQRGIGLAGTVWQSGEPMVIEDYQKWEGRLPGSRRDALHAIVGVPLKLGAGKGSADDETIGVIGLAYTEEGRKFGRPEVEILQRFAQLSSIALDNAQLYSSSEARLQELAALNTISSLIAQHGDLEAILERIGKEIQRIFDSDFGYLALYNAALHRIEFPYVVDEGERITLAPMPVGQGITSQVLTTGAPVLLTHATSEDYERIGAIDSGDGSSPHSLLAVPVRGGDQVVGVLSVQRVAPERPYVQDDLRLLTTVAASIGVGIENIRLAQATAQRVQELAALNSISAILNTTDAFETRLRAVGLELTKIFNVSNVYIVTYDAEHDIIEMPFYVEDGVQEEIPPRPRGAGLVSHVLVTRETLLINENMEQRFRELGGVWIGSRGPQSKSYLGVPVVVGARARAVVALSERTAGRFSDADVKFLETIAGVVASAFQNEELAHATRQQLAELAVLNHISTILTTDKALNDRLAQVGRELYQVFGVSSVYIALYDETSKMVRMPFFFGDGQEYSIEPFALGPGFTSHIIETRAPLLINDEMARWMGELQAMNAGDGDVTQSYLGAPIMLGEAVLGVVAFSDKSANKFQSSDRNLLTTIASALASAIQNARLFSQTQDALAETNRLYRTAEAANLERDDLAFYKRVHEIVGETMPAKNFYVALYNLQEQSLAFPYYVDEKDPVTSIDLQKVKAGKGITAYCLNKREPLLVSYADFQSLRARGELETQGTDPISWLGVPILRGQEAIGVVAVQSYDPIIVYTEADKQSLVKLVLTVANIIERKRAEGELQAALAETRRLAARERAAANQVMALNRRLTREGWQDLLASQVGALMSEASDDFDITADAPASNGHGHAAPDGDTSNGKKVEVPIVLRGETIGTIELDYENPELEFSPERQEIVNDVGGKLGLVLDNARLFTEAQRRVTELDALNRISQAATTELELDALLSVIGEQVRQIFNVPNVYIALYDKTTEMISLPYFVNDNRRVQVEPLRFGEGITSEIIRTRQPVLLNQNADAIMAQLHAKVFGNPAQSYLGVPILVGDDVTGVISIQSTTREGIFDEGNLRLLETIAATIGASIQNAALYGAMEQEVQVRIRAEEEIKLSLKEKEVLLKEIHHRVKNNLQIITSLLNLQSAQIKDAETLNMFRESQARVRSMALIHEKLYQSKDLARIDFAGYGRELMVYLFRSYMINPDQIQTELDIPDIFLGIDTAIPCGLIISELVTNAMKYAFPNGRRGKIYIGLNPQQDGNLVLKVADDGVGLADDFDWRESDSLGLQLVSTLTSQLHGKMQVSGSGGASFVLTFPG